MKKPKKKPVGRPRTIDPKLVVRGIRSGKYRFGSEAAKAFGCSRVRINQILKDHAPELLPGKVKPLTADEQGAITSRQAETKRVTVEALKAHKTLVEAASALRLTESGLQSRMRRLDIDREEIGSGQNP